MEKKQKIQLASQEIKASLKELAEFDFSIGFEVAELLEGNQKLLSKFAKNPRGFIHEHFNVDLPEGYHAHYIDHRLVFIPFENTPEGQLIAANPDGVWQRIEVRAGIGAKGCIVCIYCPPK